MLGGMTTGIKPTIIENVGDVINDITGVNAQLRREQQWQDYMRSTNYQAAIKDMKAAGLNPAMFYQSGGQGAEAPSSPTASGSRGIHAIGQVASAINAITNARALDAQTRQNEIKHGTAVSLYKETAKIAKMLAKYMA